MPTVTLIGKPGCHLCDDARAVVQDVLGDLERQGRPVRLVERSILDDAGLQEAYGEDIPVVLVGERFFARWHVDPERLRAELTA
ncbi:glutaredoxin family protein [Amnibacterium sp. CER49]|uniref:glutaredoxin family protein n=1 Tax=Amnibacterium sp. CER49 TaxID=3039161 RepID=UPI00244D010C|nr:glutaredoxin family protein [Amnibacterium sp. CER49]MDH2443423.1 glutaredoxin family protein [Amnibacterium sp. CER49]